MTPLRVMTFNVRNGRADDGANSWPHRIEAATQLIRDSEPDLVGLQEPFHFQVEDILGKLPGYVAFGVAREDGGTEGEFASILFRLEHLHLEFGGTFWFSDRPETPGSMSWGNRLPRICTWAVFKYRTTGVQFQFANVHLDHESEASRQRSVEMLISRFGTSSRLPNLVVGDFNATPEHAPILSMQQSSFRDLAGLGGANGGTFHEYGIHDTPDRIDYIWGSQEFTVIDAKVIDTCPNGQWPSDHYPVMANLEL